MEKISHFIDETFFILCIHGKLTFIHVHLCKYDMAQHSILHQFLSIKYTCTSKYIINNNIIILSFQVINTYTEILVLVDNFNETENANLS